MSQQAVSPSSLGRVVLVPRCSLIILRCPLELAPVSRLAHRGHLWNIARHYIRIRRQLEEPSGPRRFVLLPFWRRLEQIRLRCLFRRQQQPKPKSRAVTRRSGTLFFVVSASPAVHAPQDHLSAHGSRRWHAVAPRPPRSLLGQTRSGSAQASLQRGCQASPPACAHRGRREQLAPVETRYSTRERSRRHPRHQGRQRKSLNNLAGTNVGEWGQRERPVAEEQGHPLLGPRQSRTQEEHGRPQRALEHVGRHHPRGGARPCR